MALYRIEESLVDFISMSKQRLFPGGLIGGLQVCVSRMLLYFNAEMPLFIPYTRTYYTPPTVITNTLSDKHNQKDKQKHTTLALNDTGITTPLSIHLYMCLLNRIASSSSSSLLTVGACVVFVFVCLYRYRG